jgi:hypothetical protein
VSVTGVSPRTISNDTSQPVLVWGRGLRPGLLARLGPPLERHLPLTVVDDSFGSLRLPDDVATPPYCNPPAHATLEDTSGYVGSQGEPEGHSSRMDRGSGTSRLLKDATFMSARATAPCPHMTIARRPS